MKWIIADKRIPEAAARQLSKFGKLLLFESQNITYSSIAGHPDIFMSCINNQLIVAPNTPSDFIRQLDKRKILYTFGIKAVGSVYPETSSYNALVDSRVIIHNFRYTDTKLLQHTKSLEQISVKQGYSRCNCISLHGKGYICSDRGIEKALQLRGKEVIFVEPDEIVLSGMQNGFIGGCAGVFDDQLVLTGSLKTISGGAEIRKFAQSLGFEIIELYQGPLFDGGGIMMIL